MIIDALMCLSRKGFDIAEYQYTGMGSVHFVDFILFHRILGIRKMLSAEYSTGIPKRITFNKPYRYIDVAFKAIGDVIPSLDPDLQHILWLDYDFRINKLVTTDVVNAAAALSAGSILMVTVDVESPVEGMVSTPRKCRKYYLENCKPFCSPGWPMQDYAESKLHALNVRILFNAIKAGLADCNPPRAWSNERFSSIRTMMWRIGSIADSQDSPCKTTARLLHDGAENFLLSPTTVYR
jgi:hypothetical protein